MQNQQFENPQQLAFPRAVEWKLRTRTLQLGWRPLLMGIVNVTPDSFSDGGRYLDSRRAVEQGLQLLHEGADILDIGGESTRPYSQGVSAEEELGRVQPVFEGILARVNAVVSIDTSKALVAKAALDAGVEIINDVSGLEGDAEMLPLAVRSGAGVCVMHRQGTPQTMQNAPSYTDATVEILEYLKQRKLACMHAGLEESKISLDPGIGFGKTHRHNLELLQNAARFHELASPILMGHSRKGFIAHVLKDRHKPRLSGVIGVSLALAKAGIQILRIHDVGPVREALDLFAASGGLGNAAAENIMASVCPE